MVVGVAGCLLLSSCGGYVARGRHLYAEGRYIESAELLARHERELADEPPGRQAEYATYRGLSNLVIGNYPEAQRWMTYAYEIVGRYPRALRPDFRMELDQGWYELTSHLGPKPVKPPPDAHAVVP